MGRPTNFSRIIVERARRAADAAVTRHDNLTKVKVSVPAPLSAGAARTRRYRERRKRAGVLVEIEIAGTALDDLVALGWLAPGCRGDRPVVADAVAALADYALTLRIRPAS